MQEQETGEPFHDDQLKFKADGSLASIIARADARLELYHPLISPMSEGADASLAHYSRFVKQIDFSRGQDGVVLRAVLEAKPDLGIPSMTLGGQRVELAAPSEIVLLPDSSLRLKLSGCYRDPGSRRDVCGDVLVNSSGAVKEFR